MKEPLVEVIIPVYNAEKTIERTIQSVISQTYKNWKLFVINDGSTDGTLEILNKFKNKKIKVVTKNNGGVSSARNVALDLIKGSDYVAYCDADDWWEPNHLLTAIACLEVGNDFFYCNPNIVGSEGQRLYPNFPLYDQYNEKNFKFGNFIYISTVVHKGKLGYFDSDLDSLEDYDMWLRAMKLGYKFFQHSLPTATYLATDSGMAGKGVVTLNKLKKKHSDIFKPIRLHLASGTEYLEDWTNCDLYAEKVDERFDVAKVPYPDNSVDEIRAYHIIEHFDFYQSQEVLREWYRILKPGGKIRMETPDLLNTCKRFVESDENFRITLYGHFFAWPWLPGQQHKFLFTQTQLTWTLENIGYKNIKRLQPDSIYAAMGNPADLYLNMEAYK